MGLVVPPPQPPLHHPLPPALFIAAGSARCRRFALASEALPAAVQVSLRAPGRKPVALPPP